MGKRSGAKGRRLRIRGLPSSNRASSKGVPRPVQRLCMELSVPSASAPAAVRKRRKRVLSSQYQHSHWDRGTSLRPSLRLHIREVRICRQLQPHKRLQECRGQPVRCGDDGHSDTKRNDLGTSLLVRLSAQRSWLVVADEARATTRPRISRL